MTRVQKTMSAHKNDLSLCLSLVVCAKTNNLMHKGWRISIDICMCKLRSPFFLSLCRFKGIRTITAWLSLIRRSLSVFRLWGSPVHRIPHAVITLTIHYDQQLHTAIIQYFSVNNSCVWEWVHVVVEIAMNSQEVKLAWHPTTVCVYRMDLEFKD